MLNISAGFSCQCETTSTRREIEEIVWIRSDYGHACFFGKSHPESEWHYSLGWLLYCVKELKGSWEQANKSVFIFFAPDTSYVTSCLTSPKWQIDSNCKLNKHFHPKIAFDQGVSSQKEKEAI